MAVRSSISLNSLKRLVPTWRYVGSSVNRSLITTSVGQRSLSTGSLPHNSPSTSSLPPLPAFQPVPSPQLLDTQHVSPLLYQLRLAVWQFDRDKVWQIYETLLQNDQLPYLSAKDHFHIFYSITLRGYLWFNESTADYEKEKILSVWKHLHEFGHTPGVREYNHLLEFLARACDVKTMEAVFGDLQTQVDATPNFYTYNMLMYGYAKTGHMDKVMSIFEVMRTRFQPLTNFSRTVLIELYGSLGRPEAALKLYRQPIASLQSGGTWASVANVHSTNALLRALGRNRRIREMREVFTDVWRQYGKNGLNYTSFDIMINWHAQQNQLTIAKQYFEMMQEQPFGYVPNPRTFKHLAPPAVCATNPEFTREVVDRMTNEFKLKPLSYMLRSVVDYYEQEYSTLDKDPVSVESETSYTVPTSAPNLAT
ncbi:hypothetical protein IWQ62_004322 [Dispira parvispora]|uniref:Pentatricopeptide repeat-containing protein n=1 Tax=Dispira parvispora TaxID=1520584 RepID=A0A9W8E0S7_9FUNG|nr:hypothetical protein IWQ62_004322 [Dispira parvispora]